MQTFKEFLAKNEMVEEGWREAAAAAGLLGLSWLPGVQSAHAPEHARSTAKTSYVQNINKTTPTIHSQPKPITPPKTTTIHKSATTQKPTTQITTDKHLKDIVARTLWAEARGEGERGIRAVATVLINRAKGNPVQLKKVIKPIQFSSWNNGVPKVKLRNKTDVETWNLCQQISNEVVTGTFKPLGRMTINLKDFITQHEGKRHTVYQDTVGIPTIGVGFNLRRTNAKLLLSQVGANYDIILNGDEPLTNEQIDILLDHDIETATINAKNFIDNFDEQPDNMQKVLIDMAFNLGYNRLNQFQKFKKAVENKNYQQAANEMINSKWYNQVKNRGKELVEIVRNLDT